MKHIFTCLSRTFSKIVSVFFNGNSIASSNATLLLCSSDDRVEAYQTLKQLVKEYLGLEEHGGGGDSSSVTPDNTSTSELSQSHFAIH